MQFLLSNKYSHYVCVYLYPVFYLKNVIVKCTWNQLIDQWTIFCSTSLLLLVYICFVLCKITQFMVDMFDMFSPTSYLTQNLFSGNSKLLEVGGIHQKLWYSMKYTKLPFPS